jgi:multidrug efflux pump subunit AcrA (membrane-fusion protein)
MKRTQIIIGGVIVLGFGLGIFALIKSPHATSASDDEGGPSEKIPSLVSVQTATLQRMTLHRYVTGYGMVEAAPATAERPAAGAQLAAPSAGIVVKVNVVEGQQVTNGGLVVDLSSDSAKQEMERQKKLYAQHDTSLKALQDAHTQLALEQVISPVSGTVTRLNVKAGEAVDVNTVVAEEPAGRERANPGGGSIGFKDRRGGAGADSAAGDGLVVVGQPGGGPENRCGSGLGVAAGGQRLAPRPIRSTENCNRGSSRLSRRTGGKLGDR